MPYTVWRFRAKPPKANKFGNDAFRQPQLGDADKSLGTNKTLWQDGDNMDILRTLIIGLVMGVENVIPGVSGGTMAAIFNIYDQFVSCFSFNIKRLWKNRKFVIPLIIGMLLGVLIFANLVSILYERFPTQTNCFFTGLIIGSLPVLFHYMVQKKDNKKFSTGKIVVMVICVIVAFAFLLFIGHLEGKFDSETMTSNLPPQDFKLTMKLFFAGVLGAFAMLVPGVSGSLANLMMGVYPVIMKSIPSLFIPNLFVKSFLYLIPNGIGLVIGLVTSSKIIRIIMSKVPNHSYAVIFGLICASAVNIFPTLDRFNSTGVIVGSAVSLVIGAVLTYFSTRLGEKEESKIQSQNK